MNSSSCSAFVPLGLILLSSTNAFSLFVCILAVILMCSLKLHKKPVYRLALYQVLAAMMFTIVCGIQMISIHHPPPKGRYLQLCKALAYLDVFSLWAKTLFTVCGSIHLFCFVVFFKNLRRYEALYVIVSTLLPGIIAAVPLTTETYGLSGSWCWIESWKNNCPNETLLVGGVEQFALWYGPSLILVSIASIAMIIMMIILFRRKCGRRWISDGDSSRQSSSDTHGEAMKQLLPLSAYPITFLIFLIPPFINRVYDATLACAEHCSTSGQCY